MPQRPQWVVRPRPAGPETCGCVYNVIFCPVCQTGQGKDCTLECIDPQLGPMWSAYSHDESQAEIRETDTAGVRHYLDFEKAETCINGCHNSSSNEEEQKHGGEKGLDGNRDNDEGGVRENDGDENNKENEDQGKGSSSSDDTPSLASEICSDDWMKYR